MLVVWVTFCECFLWFLNISVILKYIEESSETSEAQIADTDDQALTGTNDSILNLAINIR